jgi:hypothetical protein
MLRTRRATTAGSVLATRDLAERDRRSSLAGRAPPLDDLPFDSPIFGRASDLLDDHVHAQ